jgi:hypothetical protein
MIPNGNDMPDDAMLSELTAAGQAVDKAIQQMLEFGLSPVAIASALLGGSLCLVSKTMGEEGVIQLLRNAEAGVRAGDLAERR